MRKKLLALLMCATMVLGSSAVASAADITNTDVTNAKAIINQYDADKGAVVYEYDAKTSPITFVTNYVSGTDKVIYTYAFTGTDDKTYTSATSYVKTSSDGKTAYTKTSGYAANITALDETKHAIAFTQDTSEEYVKAAWSNNPSTKTTDILGSVLMASDKALYYVSSAEERVAGDAVAAGEYIVAHDEAAVVAHDIQTNSADPGTLTTNAIVITLSKFTADETGDVVAGSSINKYGMDEDGYIARKDADTTAQILKFSSKVASGYWVNIAKATGYQADIAQALADGEITTNAVAVKVEFYKVKSDSDSDIDTVSGSTGYKETGFKKLSTVSFEESNIDVTFKADWLSRSNAKNANVVYVLRNGSSDFEKYFFNYGTVLKVSDLADDSFTTKNIASGVYLFDYVEDASQNDGVNDEATTAATTAAPAADTAATSPKTGDVAPIAALAVVMMGACGAMVVASKKRA